MIEKRDAGDHLQRRVEHVVRTVGHDALVGNEHVLDRDVVAARAAHAERVPVVVDGDAVDLHGHGHVEHALAAFGIVVDEHRGEHVAGGRLAGEHLAAAHLVAAVDLDRLAAGPGEVTAAGGHEHDPVVDDPAQRRLRPRQAAPVAPGGERRDVLVHRRGERRRAAVLGELALHHRHLADRRPLAAELGRYRDREQPRVLDVLERLGHPGAVPVVPSGVLGEHRSARRGPCHEQRFADRVFVSSSVVMGANDRARRQCATSTNS